MKLKMIIFVLAALVLATFTLYAQSDSTGDNGGGPGGFSWVQLISYALNILFSITGVTWVRGVKNTKDKLVTLVDTILNGAQDGNVTTAEVEQAKRDAKAIVAKEKA